MTGSLQEKKGNYYIVISTTVVEHGKKKHKKKWFSTGLKVKGNKRKAEVLLRKKIVEYENELKYGNGLYDKEMLFSLLILQWLEYRKNDKKKAIRQNTWEGYRRNINKHVIPYFEDRLIELKDMRNKDLEIFYDYLLEKGLSGNTVRKIHTNIHSALAYAVSKELIRDNPANNIERLPTIEKFRAKFYTEKQLKEYYKVVVGEAIEAVIKLTGFYGLRRSEVLGLRWSAIDFEENTILINHTAIKLEEGIQYIDGTKNTSSYRLLPLSRGMKVYLERLKAEQAENRRIFGNAYDNNDYICKWIDGRLLSLDYVSHRHKELLEANGLEVIRFHDLRHTSASNLIRLGFSLKEVQEWLGHSSITITANIYAHLEYETKVQMADKLDEKMAACL